MCIWALFRNGPDLGHLLANLEHFSSPDNFLQLCFYKSFILCNFYWVNFSFEITIFQVFLHKPKHKNPDFSVGQFLRIFYPHSECPMGTPIKKYLTIHLPVLIHVIRTPFLPNCGKPVFCLIFSEKFVPLTNRSGPRPKFKCIFPTGDFTLPDLIEQLC